MDTLHRGSDFKPKMFRVFTTEDAFVSQEHDLIIDKMQNKIYIVKEKGLKIDKSSLSSYIATSKVSPIEAELLKITQPTVTLSKEYAKPGETVSLTASGSVSPDSTNITYHWILPNGSTFDGDTLSYTIPSTAKDGDSIAILCQATDDKNNKSPFAIAQIKVVDYYPPIIDSIEWNKTLLIAEQSATATVHAHDPNLDTLTFSVEVSDPDIVVSKNNNKFTFHFPNKDTHPVDFTFIVQNTKKSISQTVTKNVIKITEKNILLDGNDLKPVAIRQINDDNALWIVNRTSTKEVLFIKFNFADVVDWFSIGGINIKDDYNVSPVSSDGKLTFVTDDNKIFRIDVNSKTIEKVVEITDNLENPISGVDKNHKILFAKSSSDHKWGYCIKLNSNMDIEFAKKYELNKTGDKYSDSSRLPIYDFVKVINGIIYGYYAKSNKDITEYNVSDSSAELYYYNSSGIRQWINTTWNGLFFDMSGKDSFNMSIPSKKTAVGKFDAHYYYTFAESNHEDHRFVALIDASTPSFILKYKGKYFVVNNQNPASGWQKYFLPFDTIQNVSISPETQVAVSFPTYNLKGISFKTSNSVGIKLFYYPQVKNKKKCNTLKVEDIEVHKVSGTFFKTAGGKTLAHYLPSGYQYYSYDMSPYPGVNDITSSYTVTDKPSLSFSSCPLIKRVVTPNTDLQPFGDDSCILYYKFNGNLNDEFNNFNAVDSKNIAFVKFQGIDSVKLTSLDSFIKFNRPTSSSTDPFSISFFVNTTSYYGSSGPAEQVQVMGCRYKYGVHDKRDFILQVKNGNYGKARTYYGKGSGVTNDTNFVLSDGLWHHVAIIFDGAYLEFYIDGTQISNYYTGTNGITDEVSYWYIGNILPEVSSSHNPSSMIGYVAHFRVFNRALTIDEINQLYDIDFVK